MPYSKDESSIVEANIVYHSALAKDYDTKQPYFKEENVKRVSSILTDLASKTGGGSLIDLGCGTGFIIDIAKNYFRQIVGIDITPDMLKQVKRQRGKVEINLANTTYLPIADNSFDVCTASSFLHHLYDLRPTLEEAFRCLRPGGRFYSDQDPNYYYWKLMDQLRGREDLSGIVDSEFRSVVYDVEEVISETGLSPDVIKKAEYQMKKGGIDAEKVVALMQEIGFHSVHYHYEWYLGQGKVLHQQSAEDSRVIENFLRESLPATRHLFKYLSIYGVK